jgi:hypothetical protein
VAKPPACARACVQGGEGIIFTRAESTISHQTCTHRHTHARGTWLSTRLCARLLGDPLPYASCALIGSKPHPFATLEVSFGCPEPHHRTCLLTTVGATASQPFAAPPLLRGVALNTLAGDPKPSRAFLLTHNHTTRMLHQIRKIFSSSQATRPPAQTRAAAEPDLVSRPHQQPRGLQLALSHLVGVHVCSCSQPAISL